MNDRFIRLTVLALTLVVALVVLEQALASPAGDLKSNSSLRSLWSVRSANGFHQFLEDGAGFSFVIDKQQIGGDVSADADIVVRNLEYELMREDVSNRTSYFSLVFRRRANFVAFADLW